MNNTHNKQRLYLTGWIFIVLSCSIFGIGLQAEQAFSLDLQGSFWLNFILTALYGIFILIQYGIRWAKKEPEDRPDARHWSIFLVLFTISAFALNEELHLFEEFPLWLNIYTGLMVISLLIFPYKNKLPHFLQYILYFMCGASIVYATYLTWFMGPLLVYSIPLALVFGLSLHTYVPLLWLITFWKYAFKMNDLPHTQKMAWAGAIIPVLALSIYLYKWQQVQNAIESVKAEYELKYAADYPEWMILSQRLPDDPLTEMVLMSPVTTQDVFWMHGDGWGFIDANGFEKKHHPLAVIAGAMYGKLDINQDILYKILETKYDARHQTERRLWRGGDLTTKMVSTNVRIYPEYRLAYTEKTLNIHNDPNRSNDAGWYDTELQEAVYTFHLPQGSVVSSLSLWVDGKEEKSRLTTRHKADSAYQEIVGVQRRDPSLLHWQEGNRVTVTVFPCAANEDRQFKIGVTSPLIIENEKLILQSIWFEGPAPEQTTESIRLKFEGNVPANIHLPLAFKETLTGDYSYTGKFQPYWEVTSNIVPINKNPFVFNGNSYHLENINPKTADFSPENFVLDITNEWHKSEIDDILALAKGKKCYVFTPEKTEITPENAMKLYSILRKNHFSMLPLYRIENPANTLIITKMGHKSPLLSDMEQKENNNSFRGDFADTLQPTFVTNMKHYLSHIQSEKVKVWNIGKEISPYYQSLKQFRTIDYAQGRWEDLVKYLAKKQFPISQETDNQVVLYESQITIVRNTATLEANSNAPDHLFRLYAYNDLLRIMGKDFYDRKNLEDIWVRKAEEAYICTPVSSLIVLETQQDYEKMGIKENENTLGNAHIGSKGSVPEPHEWALIIVVLCVMLWQFISSRFTKI